MFSNREIAVGVWLLAFLIFALTKQDLRGAFWRVLRTIMRLKILVLIGLALVYVASAIILLRALQIWTTNLTKDTVFWFLFSGLAVAFSPATFSEGENIFKKIIVDSMKVIVLIEFITSTYTLSVPAELVIVPVMTILAMVDAGVSSNEKYAPAGRLVTWLQAVIGFIIVFYATREAIVNYSSLGTLDTLRTVVLAPLLSILFVPFVYASLLYMDYESLFLRLKIGIDKPPDVQRYAKRRLITHLGLRLRRVRKFLNDYGQDLRQVRTREDVDRLLHEADT